MDVRQLFDFSTSVSALHEPRVNKQRLAGGYSMFNLCPLTHVVAPKGPIPTVLALTRHDGTLIGENRKFRLGHNKHALTVLLRTRPVAYPTALPQLAD